MMAMAISIGSAVGSGFNLIGKRPLSVISWGFFVYVAIFGLLGIGVAIVGLPVLGRLAALNGQTPDPAQVQQMMLGFVLAIWPALLLVTIGGLFVGAMVQAAVIRSILTPEQRGFASLRFGRAEVRWCCWRCSTFPSPSSCFWCRRWSSAGRRRSVM